MQSHRPFPLFGILGIAIVMLVIIGGAIYAVSYQKDQPDHGNNSNSSNSSSASNGSADSNSAQRGTGGGSLKGTVTAISAESITIKLPDGTTKTYSITADTTISNAATQSFGSSNSGQSDADSIKMADTVLVTPDPAHVNQAVGILINP